MAESRIVEYNPQTKKIHWFYNRHEDDERVDVHEHVHCFIERVIRHCPNENFKMTGYYGFYSNRYNPMLDNIYELYGKKIKRKTRTLEQRKEMYKNKINKLKYRYHMIKSYSKDAIRCKCG